MRGARLIFAMAYVIKRYSNRKLYDTQESRYVTLEELEELIRAGREISVVDVSTGEAACQAWLDGHPARRARASLGRLGPILLAVLCGGLTVGMMKLFDAWGGAGYLPLWGVLGFYVLTYLGYSVWPRVRGPSHELQLTRER